MERDCSRVSGHKRRLNRKRLKTVLLILLAIADIIVMLLSGGVVKGFFIIFTFGIVCAVVVYGFKSRNASEENEKAVTPRNEKKEALQPSAARGRAVKRVEKAAKNYNWVVEDSRKREAFSASASRPKTEKTQEDAKEEIKADIMNRISALYGSIPEHARTLQKNSVIRPVNTSFRAEASKPAEAAEKEQTAAPAEALKPIEAAEKEQTAAAVIAKEDWDVTHYEEMAAQPVTLEPPAIEDEKQHKAPPIYEKENIDEYPSRYMNEETDYSIEEEPAQQSVEFCEAEDENKTDCEDLQYAPEVTEDIPYSCPPISLLNKIQAASRDPSRNQHSEQNAVKLVEALASFGVGAKVINISEGPSVTRYELQPDYGVKVSKIVNLTDDIALNLAATGVRIEAPIPGKSAVGIEVPNKEITPVLFRDVAESEDFQGASSKIAFAVGKDVAGNAVVADITKMPHLLIAGATGSGKSVCINTLIASILFKASPSQVKLLMIDPKVVELSIYNGIPHLLVPVVTDPKKAAGALNWAVQEMTGRYKLFADNNVRDLKGYNRLIKSNGEGDILPQIVIIIDELADLMMAAPNDVEDCICRLAQMARAAGMHLVIATQRPSVDVITGVIKANVPSRISFAVSSQIDSRTILDMGGAEKLLGRGDMLFSPVGMSKPLRVQGAFISDGEVESIVSYLKAEQQPQYDQQIINKIDRGTESSQADIDSEDELLPQVISMVIEQGQASTSLVQRKFKLGYSRAARILDQMEAGGIVGSFEGSRPRKVLITKEQWEEMNG
ncbi:DNA translocase FtsK [Anaerobacterium chartisolvens]|uniref:DNA translocase FtsK n=1 Tax=Anaerobacterium chartisolvens TaxID=1297424 RepID=A0A369AYR5_9FIRM|nr:DNA translocase FtsK [Anaerobacterium chartisolvens]RCX13478.1 DNA translocase FtsK [Anaerobacterium chartisolvens]